VAHLSSCDTWLSDVSSVVGIGEIDATIKGARKFLAAEFVAVLVIGLSKLSGTELLQHTLDWCNRLQCAFPHMVAVPGCVRAPPAHRFLLHLLTLFISFLLLMFDVHSVLVVRIGIHLVSLIPTSTPLCSRNEVFWSTQNEQARSGR
jgi:hypothetical protein